MNKYPLMDLRNYVILDEEDYDVSEGLEDDDLRRKKERAKAFFPKQFGYFIGSAIAEWEVEPFSLLQQISELQKENGFLQQQIMELRNQVNELMKSIPVEKTIVLRKISKEKAKKEIKELFASTHETLYYSDIAERLGLELRAVVEICKDLIKEGEIKVDTKTL